MYGRIASCRSQTQLVAVLVLQVDLVMSPDRREAMLAASGGVRQLPQVHVNGKVSTRCSCQAQCSDVGRGPGCIAPFLLQQQHAYL
jgi:hypothetical protein